MNHFIAKIEKPPRKKRIAGKIQRVCDKSPVARPKIAVMIGCAFGYIRIICRQYRAVVIDLRSDDESERL